MNVFEKVIEAGVWKTIALPKEKLLETLIEPLNGDVWDCWPITEIMAKLSFFSYQETESARQEITNLGFDHVYQIENNPMACYIGYSKNTCVIIFRGTNELRDWLFNLNFRSKKVERGETTIGFYSGYQLLRNQILRFLFSNNFGKIWITGHSLGGALALLCAHDLEFNQNLSIQGLMTFGQPMVVSYLLSQEIDLKFGNRFVHFVNGSDGVPHLPINYYHCGNLLWWKDDKIFRLKKTSPKGFAQGIDSGSQELTLKPMTEPEFEKFLADLNAIESSETTDFGLKKGFWIPPQYTDHLMISYLEKIQVY